MTYTGPRHRIFDSPTSKAWEASRYAEKHKDDDAPLSVASLLARAKTSIANGETSLHEAAEDIAAAAERGATQRKIAEAVGKSAAWVNGLLAWRLAGYPATAFGPASKAARTARAAKAEHVQATKHEKPKATTSEQAQAQTAKAKAQQAKAEAVAARHRAQQAKAEARKARTDAKRARDERFAGMFTGLRQETKEIHSGPRSLLVKALGMLGSSHDGEILSAAHMVEKQRAKLGATWDQLIVEATG